MRHQKTGFFMLLWMGIIIVLYLLFKLLPIFQHQEKTVSFGKEHTVIIPMGLDQHFRVQGMVSGIPVRFLVDTGATYVSLPLNSAFQKRLPHEGKVLLSTAGGERYGIRTTIDTLRVGNIELHHVQAVLMPGLSEALLGMSFLSHTQTKRSNEKMKLTQIKN